MNILMRIKAECLNLISRIDSKGFGLFYTNLREFQTSYADIFTFIINDYPKLELQEFPDPHFEEALQRIYESTNAYNAVQLTMFFRSTAEVTAAVFARRRVPGSWLLYLAYMEGISPDWVLKGKMPRYLGWRERGIGRRKIHELRKTSLWWRLAERIAKGAE